MHVASHTPRNHQVSRASHNQLLPYFTSPSLESSERFPQVRFIPHSSSGNPNTIGNGNVHVASHTHSNEPPSILCFSQSAFTLLYFSFTGIIGEIPTSQIHPSLKFWQSKQYQQWQRACCITHTKEPPSTSCASHNQILPYFTSPSLESSERFPQVRFIPRRSSFGNPNSTSRDHVASNTLKSVTKYPVLLTIRLYPTLLLLHWNHRRDSHKSDSSLSLKLHCFLAVPLARVRVLSFFERPLNEKKVLRKGFQGCM